MITKDDERRLEAYTRQISEHYDSVRIFVTRHNSETSCTESMTKGIGCLYSQKGVIDEWTTQIKTAEKLQVSLVMDDDDDEIGSSGF